MIRILFLAANPLDRDHLRIRQECNEIQRALDSAEFGKRFELIQEFAVNASELQTLLFRHKPQIVHFSGHGDESGELLFEGDDGESQPVSPQTLSDLFAKFKQTVRCIVLNACYSQNQANALAQHIDCVIGMNDAISDPAALSFAPAFYRALANDTSLLDAFDLARNQLDLQQIDEAHKPQLLAERIDMSQVRAVDWDEASEPETPTMTTTINTAGGTAIDGDINTGNDFVGRDKIEGDKVAGNKTVIQQQTIIYQGTPPITHRLPTIFTVPFLRKPPEEFVGREEDLRQLHVLLQQNRAVGILPCAALTGMGGIGKTQLAVEYAFRYRDQYPSGIFWINTADPNRFRIEMEAAADRLDLNPEQNINQNAKLRAFAAYLYKHPNCLLIFDNVQYPMQLKQQLAQEMALQDRDVTMLITTRRHDLPSHMQPFDVKQLSKVAATQFLYSRRADLASDPSLPQLLRRTGCLPLMLTLAATALKLEPSEGISSYLAALDEHGVEEVHSYSKLEHDDYFALHGYSVYSMTPVFLEQWKRLCAQPDSEDAQILFRIAGLLPEASEIPILRLSLLSGVQDKGFIKPLSKGLKLLANVSLIEQLDETHTIRLHPLVRDFVAHLINSKNTQFELISKCSLNIITAYENTARFELSLSNFEMIQELILGLQLWQPVTTVSNMNSIQHQEFVDLRERIKKLILLLASEYRNDHIVENYWSSPSGLQQILYRSWMLEILVLHDKAKEILSKQSVLTLQPCWINPPKLTLVESKNLEFEDSISMRIGDELRTISYPSGRIWRFLDAPKSPEIRTLKPRIIGGENSTDIELRLDRYIAHKGENSISAVAVLSSKRIITSSFDNTLKVWDVQTGVVEQILSDHRDSVRDIVSLNGQYVVSASSDHTLKVWNIAAGNLEKTLSGHKGVVHSIAMLDKQHIISSSDDNTFKVWNIQIMELERTVHRRDQGSALLSIINIDERRVLATSDDNTIKVWNLFSGEVEQTLVGHASPAIAIRVLDAHRIISGSLDHSIKVWNLRTGKPEQTFHNHTNSVNALAVIDNKRIVSVSEDRTLKIWNLETEKESASIGLDGALQCVAVVRQEKRTLVVAGDVTGSLYCLELVEPKHNS